MFFIAALPRSRTAWFASYFDGLPGVTCHHELTAQVATRGEFYRAMEWPGCIGNADCSLPLTDFQERWPDAPTVVIHRPIDDVALSLQRLGLYHPGLDSILQHEQGVLAALRGVHIAFDSIDERLEDLHRHLVRAPFDASYAETVKRKNIQRVAPPHPRFPAMWRFPGSPVSRQAT